HAAAPDPRASGYWGVQRLEARKGWLATIWGRPRYRFLGLFDNAHNAARAYNAAAKELYGEEAFLNGIDDGRPDGSLSMQGTAAERRPASLSVVDRDPVAGETRSDSYGPG